MWLQGRSELTYRSQNPFRLNGDVTVDGNGVADRQRQIARSTAAAVEGRIAWTHDAKNGAAFEAALKAERLDLDSANAFARAVIGPQGEWPERAKLSLSVNHAISAGQDLHPFAAKIGYDPKSWTLDILEDRRGQRRDARRQRRLRPDQCDRKTRAQFGRGLAVAAGGLDRSGLAKSGRAPQRDEARAGSGASEARARRRQGSSACRSRQRAGHDRSRRAAVQGVGHDLGQAGRPRTCAMPISTSSCMATSRSRPRCRRSRARPCSRYWGSMASSPRAMDPASFRDRSRVRGARRFVSSSISPAPASRPRRKAPPIPLCRNSIRRPMKASLSLKARGLNLSPLFDLRPSDKAMQDVGLSTRVSFANGKVTLDDIDGTIAGSRLRGRRGDDTRWRAQGGRRSRPRCAGPGAGLCT